MYPSASTTLLRIARCPELEEASSPESSCNAIASLQAHLPAGERQVPEPWRGSTEAPLLFISSNPSIDPADDSPTFACPDSDLIQYFDAGFPKEFPRVRLRTGEIRPTYVRFWAYVLGRAAELLEVDRRSIRPGVDFAITELVHCKSTEERGVAQALPMCIERHWQGVQRAMKARLFVALGAVAANHLAIEPGQLKKLTHPEGGVRWLSALPHANAFDGKTFARRYSESDLRTLRDALHSIRYRR